MPDETVNPLSDNAALNSMVAELEDLNSFLANRYDRVAGDGVFVALTDAAPRLRGAVPTAVKTVITNKGPNQVEVRENGVLVLLVAASSSQVLPMAGAGPLRISVATGQTANIAVATFTKA